MQDISKVDELEVSWDDSYCGLIHKKCDHKSYYSDTKCDI